MNSAIRRLPAIWPLRWLLIFLASIGFAGTVTGALPSSLAGREGDIDGQGAVALFLRDGTELPECRVHVAIESEMEREETFPCATWFLPPAYGTLLRAWIEGRHVMSPDPERFVPRPEPPGTVVPLAALGPAGNVVLPFSTTKRDVVLRLLDVDPFPLRAGRLPVENIRSVPPQQWQAGVLMPAGQAVGWLWDLNTRQIVALSQPFEVRPGVDAVVPLSAASAANTQLMAVITRNPEAYETDETVAVRLRAGGKTRQPDLLVPTAFRVYAFWFEVEAGSWELEAETESSLLPKQSLELKTGVIERVAANLVPRPRLTVELSLPSELEDDEMTLEILRASTRELVTSRVVEGRQTIFELLPADLLEVRLKTSLGHFSENADLSFADDLELKIEPEIIAITGSVFLDGEGHPAKVTFTTERGEELETRAAENGAYSFLSLEALKFVEIDLENGQAPHFDFFEKRLAQSQLLDIYVKTSVHTVRVLDAVTGNPVPDAQVAVRNTFDSEPAESGSAKADRRSSKKVVMQAVRTGADGRSVLPGLRPGELELRAGATGYSRNSKPSRFEIGSTEEEREFELLLEPEGAVTELAVQLADGSPAAAAEMLVLADLNAPAVLHSTRTGPDGIARLPAKLASNWLLVRHPLAASFWMVWSGKPGPALRLGVPGSELVFRITNREKQPIPGAQLSLWLDGIQMSGSSLGWLGQGGASADMLGFVRLRNLPQKPVLALAWSADRKAAVLAGAFDQQASRINHPWAEVVELEGLE